MEFIVMEQESSIFVDYNRYINLYLQSTDNLIIKKKIVSFLVCQGLAQESIKQINEQQTLPS
jgi:hypothetical protein